LADSAQIGKIGWIDISVDDAEGLSEFYAVVTGWKADAVDMGEYNDFNMTMPSSGEPAAGICHARGSNAAMPSKWLIYIVVADAQAQASAAACVENGGKILVEPRSMGDATFCVIEDPAGAVAGLYQAS
jgi:predicted enzyme related to lactoylglutathione lyase